MVISGPRQAIACQLDAVADRVCRQCALWTLANLSYHDSKDGEIWCEAKDALITASQLDAVADRECREWALWTIANLVSHDGDNSDIWTRAKKALVVASGLEAAADRVCRKQALRAIANLACDDSNRSDIWTTAKISLVAASGLDAAAGRECHEWALCALANLARHNSNKEDIWSKAKNPLIAAATLANAVRGYAIMALGSLATIPRAVAEMRSKHKKVLLDAAYAALINPNDEDVETYGRQLLCALLNTDGGMVVDGKDVHHKKRSASKRVTGV